MVEDLYSLTFLIPTSIAIISIMLNLLMFFSKRKGESTDKVGKLVTEHEVLKIRVDNIEGPIKTIQNEMLIKFLRTNYDTPEKVLRNVGVDQ